jgi:hypothetical protein
MGFIKQFITDFVHQPKHLFFRKYFLLPSILFLGWVTIANAFEQTYDTGDLDRISGQIASMEEVTTSVINKPAYKKKRKELRVYLKGVPEYFRLTDSFDYSPVTDKLKVGEKVHVYIRKPYLAALGMGKLIDIYQLEYQGETLVHLSDVKQEFPGSIAIGAIGTILLSAFYLHQRRKRKTVKVVS